MLSKWIILFLLGSLPFGQDVIGDGLYEDELIDFLQGNYKTSTTLGYTMARDTMYLRIDRIDGQVKGIYTNYSLPLPDGVDPSTHLYQNGSSNGINCEHVWPQSLYEGGEPIKSDMHALRPCKNNVNSARNNKPFDESTDTQTITWYWQNSQTSNIPSSNIDEYSENHESYFEPREDRKGDIARTMFYFYTMYSEVAEEDFFNLQKETLYQWHLEDPPYEDETNRTWAIAEYQENKPNPFILDATLVERAYFYDGILIGDLNEDGLLNILDLVMLVDIILYDENGSPAADVNGDGAYNVLDVVMLVSIIISEN